MTTRWKCPRGHGFSVTDEPGKPNTGDPENPTGCPSCGWDVNAEGGMMERQS